MNRRREKKAAKWLQARIGGELREIRNWIEEEQVASVCAFGPSLGKLTPHHVARELAEFHQVREEVLGADEPVFVL